MYNILNFFIRLILANFLWVILLLNISQVSIAQDEVEFFDDFETIEDIDLLETESIEESVDDNTRLSELSSNARLLISNIIVIVDSKIYKNPNKHTEQPDGATSFEVLFSELAVRQGDKYKKSSLDRKMLSWNIRLARNSYYDAGNIEYRIDDDYPVNELTDSTPIILYVIIKSAYRYIYFGGPAYATLGYKMSNGIIGIYHLGANRVEADLENANILFQNKDKGYSKRALILGGKARAYWSWPQPWSNTLLYGGDVYFGLRPFMGARLTLGSQALGLTTFDSNLSNEEIINMGLPNADNTGTSLALKTNFSYHLPFEQKGFFKPGFSIELPIMLGYWNNSTDKELSFFDSYGLLLNYSIAYRLLLHQRIHLNAAVVTNGLAETQPFHAKANMKDGFYNSYALDSAFSRRGSGYSYAKYIGSKGALASLDYRFLVIEREKIALGLNAFYDVGTVANDLDSLTSNIIQSTGPGFVLYIGSPVNIVLNLGMVIGGKLLSNQEEGDSIGIDFSVNWIEE